MGNRCGCKITKLRQAKRQNTQLFQLTKLQVNIDMGFKKTLETKGMVRFTYQQGVRK